MKGIFYNSGACACSIHESGRMVYSALSKSSMYELDYTENQTLKTGYDFLVYNQHVTVNNWITPAIVASFSGPKFCVVTEVRHAGNPISGIPAWFDKYIVLDPTISESGKVLAFPRPVEPGIDLVPFSGNLENPIIGSFGLPTPGKEWTRIVEQAQHEFDEATIRINIPPATHVPHPHAIIAGIKSACESKISKAGIRLEFTSNYMEKDELIRWCSRNTLNCFFYNRNRSHPTGLCAVTDQAISSRRPLLVTRDTTFRHILKYARPFPEITMREAIETHLSATERMYEDWSQENFQKKFETTLFANG